MDFGIQKYNNFDIHDILRDKVLVSSNKLCMLCDKIMELLGDSGSCDIIWCDTYVLRIFNIVITSKLYSMGFLTIFGIDSLYHYIVM